MQIRLTMLTHLHSAKFSILFYNNMIIKTVAPHLGSILWNKYICYNSAWL